MIPCSCATSSASAICCNRERFIERDRALRDALREIVALHEFHHERGHVARALEAVDRRDVRMVERREDFGFALESREAIRVTSHRGRQYLDRDLALQVGVGRTIHLAHPAFAEERGYLVRAETGSGSQSQVAGMIAVTAEPP